MEMVWAPPTRGLDPTDWEALKAVESGVKVAVRGGPPVAGVQPRETVDERWLVPGVSAPLATTLPVEFLTVTVPLGAITPLMAETSATIGTATPA